MAILVVVVSAAIAWLAWDRPRALLAPQKAVLIEPAAEASQPPRTVQASVVWHVANDPPQVVADLSVPGRELSVKVTFGKNTDTSIPASHLVEIATHVPQGFPGGNISDVTGLALKPQPNRAGALLLGTPAKLEDGLFWIGLSDDPSDVDANLSLLRTRQYFGLEMVDGQGSAVTLVFEKGMPGDRAFERALSAWSR